MRKHSCSIQLAILGRKKTSTGIGWCGVSMVGPELTDAIVESVYTIGHAGQDYV